MFDSNGKCHLLKHDIYSCSDKLFAHAVLGFCTLCSVKKSNGFSMTLTEDH